MSDDLSPLFWGAVLTALVILGLNLFILIFGGGA